MLAARTLVTHTAMQRLPRLRDLIVSEILESLQAAGRGAAAESPTRVWQSDRLVQLSIRPGAGGAWVDVTLPESLLSACVAVLSTHTGQAMPDSIRALLECLLPADLDGAKEGGGVAGRARGIPGATKVRRGDLTAC
jgi:hypothetical protein